jgi:hypothetical protein
MGERSKGRTLIAAGEGDDAYGVTTKLYWTADLKATYNLRLVGE